ncbi:MAG: DNA alkylation repair protein [Nitrososphaerota archaeon]|nr:DNA alkylation repair protein [Nitrososphaerota archaeon]
MSVTTILKDLRSKRDPKAVAKMVRFGISSKSALGIPIPTLRTIAKKLGRRHTLALELWKSGIHEARILAAMVDEPRDVTETQMDSWAEDFDSWDVCDQCCGALFVDSPHAYEKAVEWSRRQEEFVRRAGYVMMAELAVHDKKAPDSAFLRFFEEIERGAVDDRNFVKKAVNWALRQIGKRNKGLNREAIGLAVKIQRIDAPSARWVASDALRELRSEAVQKRIKCSS